MWSQWKFYFLHNLLCNNMSLNLQTDLLKGVISLGDYGLFLDDYSRNVYDLSVKELCTY